MSSPDEVLGAIDRALDDFAVSDDAMRWTPDPPPEPEERPARRSGMDGFFRESFIRMLGSSSPFVLEAIVGPDGSVSGWRPVEGWTVTDEVLAPGEAVESEADGVRGLMSMSVLDMQPAVDAFGTLASELAEGVGRALAAAGEAFQPSVDAAHRSRWARSEPRKRRRHRRRCPTCNPGGNPRPLVIDGREYRRRRAARQRRKRR